MKKESAKSKSRITNVSVEGKKGIIVHNRILSDGPVDENGDPFLDENGEPLPGPNDDMAYHMSNNYYTFMCDSIVKKITLKDGGGEKNVKMPRFGILSMLAETTPVIVYDHPAFKEIADTAFTDGSYIFVDADFMRRLMKQERESNFTEHGVVFLLLHELMHKLYLHIDRLKTYDPKLANIAEDYVINGKLIKNYGLNPVPLLREIGVGMTPEDAAKHSVLAEETVAEMLLLKERNKKQKEKEEEEKKKDKDNGDQQEDKNDNGDNPDENPQDKKDKGQNPGDGGDEENDGEGNQPGDGEGEESDEENENGSPSNKQGKQGKGKGQSKGQGKSGQQNPTGGGDMMDNDGEEEDYGGKEKGKDDYSPIHHIKPEDLAEIMHREGLGDIAKELGIPKPGDIEGMGKKREKSKMNITDAVQNAIAANERFEGQMPGAHIAEEAAMLIDGLNKGVLTWKMKIQEVALGAGMKEVKSEEMPSDMYFLPDDALGAADIGLNQIYLPGRVPAQSDEVVLVLVDTSGSTSGQGMREAFLSEAVSIQDATANNETAKEVIIWSADTTLRGEPQSITRTNMREFLNKGVKVFGNGGTDFARCLKEAIAHPMMKNKKIRDVIYFTDCCDNPPRREDYAEFLDAGGKLTWITTVNMWNEAFNKGVEGWSTVVAIEEGNVVDLDRKVEGQSTRKNKI